MIETIKKIVAEHEGGLDTAAKITVSVTNGDVTDEAEVVTALVVVMEKDGSMTNFVVGVANAEILCTLSENASECIGRAAEKMGLREELASYYLLGILKRVAHETD